MRYYINPSGETKEAWLNNHGLEVFYPAWDLLTTNFPGLMKHPEGRGMYVCLVDNGPFTAAAICYTEQEFDEFNDPSDPRPQTWYVVPRKDIIDVCPEVAGKLQGLSK
ncbi:hypothetical protein LCGC14_3068240 [marine sediment metagenome]|uniref:Uncharacterized protein n=1 Tax=marine sediment metagenome TaxID=412755 RepID=A0A0F8WHJ0_9ZZZZ